MLAHPRRGSCAPQLFAGTEQRDVLRPALTTDHVEVIGARRIAGRQEIAGRAPHHHHAAVATLRACDGTDHRGTRFFASTSTLVRTASTGPLIGSMPSTAAQLLPSLSTSSPSIGELCLRMVNQSERGHGPVPNGPALEPRTDRLRANVNAVAPMKIAGRFRSCWISSRRFGGMVAGDRGHRVIGLITLSGMTRFVQWKTELEQEETVGADIYYRPEAIVSRSVAALCSGARSLATSQLLHWYRPPRSWPCQPRSFWWNATAVAGVTPSVGSCALGLLHEFGQKV